MSSNEPESSLSQEFQQALNALIQKIHDSESFFDALPDFESDLCQLMRCERVTVYSRGRHEREIVSKYKSGEEIGEIRVPLNTASMAGYVALSQIPILIKDVYNDNELKAIDSKLCFNRSFDQRSGFRTKSVLTIPILFREVLLGVLQLLNRNDGGVFDTNDLEQGKALAKVLAQKFRYELRGTRSPFDYLVQTKKIKAQHLKELSVRATNEGTTLQQLLISEAGITKSELGASMERYYQVPFREFDPNLNIPPELLEGINSSYLKQQLWVPIAGSRDDEVTILIDNPGDAQRIMEIQRSLPAKTYAFQVALAEDILKYLGAETATNDDASDIHELVGKLQEEVEEISSEEVDEEVNENEGTVIKLVNRIITDAYKERASDIHIEPGKGKANATVRFRVDGACRTSLSIPYTHTRAVVSRIKIISMMDISERRKPQDGKCVVKFRGQPLELRVATIPTVNGESVVMRILASSEPLPLDKLNFSESNLNQIKEISQRPHGIFLVVGPTGSGKTTTLHAVLGYINVPERKIWTAEDPVEITQPGLSQVQTNKQIGLDFAAALRSFLRADPDVIMIGEMRDQETAHIGVEASLTGHFVLSTLHTNSAPETITRLLDLGLDPVSFSDALQGVLAQRLVRTLCGECKETYPLPEEEYNVLMRYYGEEHFSELNIKIGHEVYKPKGCEKCGNTGYRGRTGIHELLVASDKIKGLIYKEAGISELKEQGLKEGMRTLMQDGIQKMLAGQTDIDQIRKVASS